MERYGIDAIIRDSRTVPIVRVPHDRHAGKPIFTLHGEEGALAGFCAAQGLDFMRLREALKDVVFKVNQGKKARRLYVELLVGRLYMQWLLCCTT